MRLRTVRDSIATVAVLVLVLSGCGESEEQRTVASTPFQSTTVASTPSPSATIDAKAIQKTYYSYQEELGLGNSPKKRCKSMGPTNWSCFFDSVEGGEAELQINLTAPARYTEEFLDEVADRAAKSYWIDIGCDYPELETIKVTVNEVDHYVDRDDLPLGLDC